MSKKTNRLLRIYSRLRKGPVTIDVIKNWAKINNVEISERSLYRDLAEIESSFLIEDEELLVSTGEKNKKIWKIEKKHSSDSLTEFNINTFHLLKNFAPVSLSSSRSESLETIEKLFYLSNSKSKFEKFTETASSQLAATHFYELPYSKGYNHILQDCIWSVQNQRVLNLEEVVYDYTSISSGIKFPLKFLPVQILYHRGVIHIGGIIDSGRIMIIALEQIKNYSLTNDMFDASLIFESYKLEMDKRFGISENVNNEVYTIEIEFSEYTGSFVSHHLWHHSQEFIQLPNGNYVLKLTCGINRELAGWIFQWMSNAKVLKPIFLEKMVVQKLQETANIYNNNQALVSNNSFKPA